MALLFFLSSLDSVWMLLVLPLLTAITFLVSWWVTETFVEQGADDTHGAAAADPRLAEA